METALAVALEQSGLCLVRHRNEAVSEFAVRASPRKDKATLVQHAAGVFESAARIVR
jgi:hypothetical protein